MNISMFDVLGPIMIGPSSSHTAGAQRIGKAMYNMIADKQLKAVHFILHGSFHLTLRGHGTDRALVGGVLGMNSYDPQIKNSLEIAKEKGIQVEFEGGDLGDVHPNTVRITAYTTDGQMTSLTGSSVGGGNIEIIDINGTAAKFTGRYPAVIINHYDRLGIISHLTSILAINQINIATVVNSRDATGKNAVTMIETESPVDSAVKKAGEHAPVQERCHHGQGQLILSICQNPSRKENRLCTFLLRKCLPSLRADENLRPCHQK